MGLPDGGHSARSVAEAVSLSEDAIRARPAPAQMDRWQHPDAQPLGHWNEYPEPERTLPPLTSWIGGQFFIPDWFVGLLDDEGRKFAEDIALSWQGGDHCVWVRHAGFWEVRAVR